MTLGRCEILDRSEKHTYCVSVYRGRRSGGQSYGKYVRKVRFALKPSID
jgi:hypothetical protein